MKISDLPFLETNPIVRAFTNDEPEKSRNSQKLLEDIENKEKSAVTSSLHIAEVIYVLTGKKYYRVKREDAANALLRLVRLTGIKIEDKPILERALVIYRDASIDLDFADAYAIAYCEENKIAEIISYDTDFDKMGLIKRNEP